MSATPVYDPEKEDLHSDAARIAAEDQRAAAERDEIKALEDLYDAPAYGETEEQAGDDADGDSPADLRDKESNAEEDGGWNTQFGKGGKQKRGFFKKHAKKLLISAIATTTAGSFILTLQNGVNFLNNLTINSDNKNLSAYSRRVRVNIDRISTLKLALDASDDVKYKQALDAYRETDPNSLMSKVNRWRPNKMTEQLLLDMQFNYGEPRKFSNARRIVSVTIDGKTIPIPRNSTGVLGKLSPTYVKDLYNYRKAINQLVRDKAGSKLLGFAMQGKIAKNLEKVFELKLYRWTKAEVDAAEKKPPTNAEVEIQETQHSYKDATRDGRIPEEVAKSASGQIADAAEEGAAQTEACMADPKCVASTIEDGSGIPPVTSRKLFNLFDAVTLRSVISKVGTVFDVSEVLCLMQQASMPNSAAVIDGNTNEAMGTYFSTSAAADAQRYSQLGDNDKRVSTKLTGGLVKQFGEDVNNSIPLRRANGRKVSTAGILGPQSSASGGHAYNPLIGILPSSAISIFNKSSGQICGALTNVWVGLGTSAIEILIGLIPGAGQVEAAGGKATSAAVSKIMINNFKDMLAHTFSVKELSKFGAENAAIDIAQSAAMALSMQYFAGGFNGASQGNRLVHQFDMGGNAWAQLISRQHDAGIPLTKKAYTKVALADRQYLAEQEASKSTFQRYLALDDPQSLLGRTAMSIHGMSFSTAVGQMLGSGNLLKNVIAVFGNLLPGKVFAAEDVPDAVNDNYGIVQWGWSEDEEDAYANNPEYSGFYNEKKFLDSGKSDAIKQKYGVCFKNEEATIGRLLADGHVRLDENGYVLDEPSLGLCSPSNLGDNNPNDGKVTFDSEEAELVFRWRVTIRDHSSIDDDIDTEEITPEDADLNGEGSGSGIVTADGYAFPVELPADNLTRLGDVPCNHPGSLGGCHHDETPAFDLYTPGNTDSKTKKVMGSKKVFAISDGTIIRMNNRYGGVQGCFSIQFVSSKDGYHYWYGHLQNADKYVTEFDPNNLNKVIKGIKAGQQIAEVADYSKGSGCWIGTPHLHIDRGWKVDGTPRNGGGCFHGDHIPNPPYGCRDPDFVPFFNDLWKRTRG